MTFTENLIQKLNPAVEAKLIELPVYPVTGDITTSGTNVSLVTYSSPKLSGFDIIEFAYIAQATNVSGADEDVELSLDFGQIGTYTFDTVTVANENNVTFYVSGKLVKMAGQAYHMTMSAYNNATETTQTIYTWEAIEELTQVLVALENTSTAADGLTFQGDGGYILLDTVNRV